VLMSHDSSLVQFTKILILGKNDKLLTHKK